MKIRLKEIPQDGRSFTFDRKSGELNDALNDLVGDRPYHVDLFIHPIGSAYEVRGTVKATTQEACSKCGYDFEMPINRKLNEILFEEETEHRKTQSVSGNQSVDFEADGPGMVPYTGDIFDAGDFVHEVIALEEPFYPMCGPNETCLHAEEVEAIQRRLEKEAEEAMETEKAGKTNGHPAFSVLKGLDLSKKN